MALTEDAYGDIHKAINGPMVYPTAGGGASPQKCQPEAEDIELDEGIYTLRLIPQNLPNFAEDKDYSLEYSMILHSYFYNKYARTNDKVWVKESKSTGGVPDYTDTWQESFVSIYNTQMNFIPTFAEYGWYPTSRNGSGTPTYYKLGEQYRTGTTIHYYWKEIVTTFCVNDNRYNASGTFVTTIPCGNLRHIYLAYSQQFNQNHSLGAFPIKAEIYKHDNDPTTTLTDPDDSATLIAESVTNPDWTYYVVPTFASVAPLEPTLFCFKNVD